VFGQSQGHGLGQWHVSRLAALRRVEHEPRAEDLHLPAHVHDAPQEIDVVDREPEHLTLAQPEIRGHIHACRVPGGQRSPHLGDLDDRHGWILRRLGGGFTDPARQGFLGIRPSSTAAESTADRLAKITRT
jgi:hypothetical protein